MEYYQGNLRQFAEELLAKGRGNGQMVVVATLDDRIVEDMKNKGEALQSVSIVVTQQAVFKYAHHPKERKGAVVHVDDYELIENTLRSPLHIYEDTAQKEFVYVFTHPFAEEQLIKVVVHPNYKLNRKTVINLAKSWGIVEKSKMTHPQYRLLK